MSKKKESAGKKLYRYWQKLHNKPAGKWLFSKLLGWNIPYTGSMKATVLELSPGKSKVLLKYRKANTNHLSSIHAIALSNLGELSSGIALLVGLPHGVRGIVTNIETEYIKKARGDLIAKTELDVPTVGKENLVHFIAATIYDNQNDIVAIVKVRWLLEKYLG